MSLIHQNIHTFLFTSYSQGLIHTYSHDHLFTNCVTKHITLFSVYVNKFAAYSQCLIRSLSTMSYSRIIHPALIHATQSPTPIIGRILGPFFSIHPGNINVPIQLRSCIYTPRTIGTAQEAHTGSQAPLKKKKKKKSIACLHVFLGRSSRYPEGRLKFFSGILGFKKGEYIVKRLFIGR